MFYGADLYIVFGQYSATCRLDHVFGHCVDDGLSFEVGPLDFISVVFRSRVEGYGQVEACVEAFPLSEKLSFRVFCFNMDYFFNCCFSSFNSLRSAFSSKYMSGNLRKIACDLK